MSDPSELDPAIDDLNKVNQNMADALNKANQAHATAYGALVILLIDKGIITQQEYDKSYIQAQHAVSQEFARKRDEAKHNEKETP